MQTEDAELHLNLDDFPDSIIVLQKSKEGFVIHSLNHNALSYTTLSRNALIGNTLQSIFPKSEALSILKKCEEVIEKSIQKEFHTHIHPNEQLSGTLKKIGKDKVGLFFKDLSKLKFFHSLKKFQNALIECSRVNHENFFATIKKVNELSVRALPITCSSIWLLNESKNELECIDIFSKHAHRHHKRPPPLPIEKYEKYIRQIEQKRHLILGNKKSSSPLNTLFKEYFSHFKVLHRFDTAIYYKGELKGVLSFESTKEENFVEHLTYEFADILSNSIEIALNIKARKENEEKFNAIVNSPQTGIIIYTDHVLYANETLCSILGYTLEEMKQMHSWDFFVPELRQAFKQKVLRRMKGEKFPRTYNDVKIVTKSGDVKIIRLSAETILYEGQYAGISIVNDITDLVKTKENLQMLAQAIEQMDELVKITDIDGNMIYVNNSMIANTGYKKIELIGQNPRMFKSGKHTKAFYKKLWDTILAKKIYRNVIINKKKSGELYYEDQTISPILDKNGEIKYFVATSKDVSTQIKLEEKLKLLATTDALTGIYNRYKMNEEIALEIKKARRYKKRFALIMFDIDFFKVINDTYGHDVGDNVLEELAKIVQKSIRETDSFGRWGGEEFMILARNIEEAEALKLAEKIRQKVEGHYFRDKVEITISLGVTLFSEGDNKEALLKRVDKALYKAKNNGRNRVELLVP